MAFIEVVCIHCRKPDDIVRNGKARSGLQRFLCRSCNETFQLDYLYNANQPGIHERIVRLTHNGSGVRDIERFLNISRTTVIAHLEPVHNLLPD